MEKNCIQSFLNYKNFLLYKKEIQKKKTENGRKSRCRNLKNNIRLTTLIGNAKV